MNPFQSITQELIRESKGLDAKIQFFKARAVYKKCLKSGKLELAEMIKEKYLQ